MAVLPVASGTSDSFFRPCLSVSLPACPGCHVVAAGSRKHGSSCIRPALRICLASNLKPSAGTRIFCLSASSPGRHIGSAQPAEEKQRKKTTKRRTGLPRDESETHPPGHSPRSRDRGAHSFSPGPGLTLAQLAIINHITSRQDTTAHTNASKTLALTDCLPARHLIRLSARQAICSLSLGARLLLFP